MNASHREHQIKNRERRLMEKLKALEEQRQRYLLAHGGRNLIDAVDVAIAAQRARMNMHMEALRR